MHYMYIKMINYINNLISSFYIALFTLLFTCMCLCRCVEVLSVLSNFCFHWHHIAHLKYVPHIHPVILWKWINVQFALNGHSMNEAERNKLMAESSRSFNREPVFHPDPHTLTLLWMQRWWLLPLTVLERHSPRPICTEIRIKPVSWDHWCSMGNEKVWCLRWDERTEDVSSEI